jgi:hypothetical protein
MRWPVSAHTSVSWLDTQRKFSERCIGPLASELLGHQRKSSSYKTEGSCSMAEQETNKAEVRAMWIMVAVVVLIIAAGTGWNMWTHPDWIHGN